MQFAIFIIIPTKLTLTNNIAAITILMTITKVFSSTKQMTNFVIGVMVVGRSVIMYDVLYKVVVVVIVVMLGMLAMERTLFMVE